jgi:phosphoglycolate phosphatase-like HAD superfamily hydrolase
VARTLIFDADDTLWESNVLFERVRDDFFAWLGVRAAPPHLGPRVRGHR